MAKDSLFEMWSHACRMLDQTERLTRTVFTPADDFAWQPPVNVIESRAGILVEVALPGIPPEAISVTLEAGHLVVRGERALRHPGSSAVIRRLELPYGLFERRIRLPPGVYEIARRDVANGCLTLALRNA